MRIGLDIDGVIYPWHYSIYRYFTEFKGYDKDISTFWMKDRHIITEYHVSIPLCYLDTSPTDDVLEYLPKLAEIAELYYITSREPHLLWATQKFFNIYDLPFKENLILSKEKANYARLLKLDYFLDDMPKYVDMLKGITNAYLFKAVHNSDVREQYEVINSLEEFYNMVKEKNVHTQMD
jgi:uncharacterized HAD superfamily protein